MESVLIVILAVALVATLAKLFLQRRALRRLCDELRWQNEGRTGSIRGGDFRDPLVRELGSEVARLANRCVETEAAILRLTKEQKQLIASVAHDFRTPLTLVRGYLELYREGKKSQAKKLQPPAPPTYADSDDNNGRQADTALAAKIKSSYEPDADNPRPEIEPRGIVASDRSEHEGTQGGFDVPSLEKLDEYLEIVDRRSRALADQLDDFYLLSLIDSDELPLRYESFRLCDLIEEEIAAWYHALSVRFGEAVEIDLADRRAIYSDRNACERILLNLIKNACAHGLAPLRISLSATEEGRLRFRLENAWVNPGLSDLSGLVKRSLTLDPSRGDKGGAGGHAGLGMAIVSELCARLDIELQIEDLPSIENDRVVPKSFADRAQDEVCAAGDDRAPGDDRAAGEARSPVEDRAADDDRAPTDERAPGPNRERGADRESDRTSRLVFTLVFPSSPRQADRAQAQPAVPRPNRKGIS